MRRDETRRGREHHDAVRSETRTSLVANTLPSRAREKCGQSSCFMLHLVGSGARSPILASHFTPTPCFTAFSLRHAQVRAGGRRGWRVQHERGVRQRHEGVRTSTECRTGDEMCEQVARHELLLGDRITFGGPPNCKVSC